MEQWTEREVRAAIGATPCCDVLDGEEQEPTGPHRWFAEALAEIVTVVAMQRMSETDRSPHPDWKQYAPELARHADEWITTARLPPGTTLARWYRENQPLLQQEPSLRERNRVVAVALLPLFEERPDCWKAIDWLDYDMSGTFAGYLENWHARVPEKLRPAVRQVAREFGIEIEDG